MKSTGLKQKVLIVGVDGATYKIITPMLKAGKLPHLERLINTGVSGDLTTTIPSLTPTAFTTFMTGVNPGKHGIFDFIGGVHLDYRNRSILNSSSIAAKTIWEIISDNEKKVISIGVPFTYPALPINGVMVSAGKLNPVEGHDVQIYPPEIGKELLENIGGLQKKYLSRYDKLFGTIPDSEFFQDLLEKIYYVFDKVCRMFFYLLTRHEWDIFMVYFNLTDQLQHFYWRFFDRDHVSYDAVLAQKFENVIYEGYQNIDKFIGEVISRIDNQTTVLVFSDHGFGPVHYLFNINYWLEEIGLLKRKRINMSRYNIHGTTFQRGLTKLGYKNLADWLPPWIGGIKLPVVRYNLDRGGADTFREQAHRFADTIDWDRTQAYADVHGININLNGREPQGIVQQGKEQEKLIQYITDQLFSLKDDVQNTPIVSEVLRKEDIYQGAYVPEATDIYFFFKEGYNYLPSPDLISNSRFTRLNGTIQFSGNHVSHRSTQKGIFLAKGPSILQAKVVEGMNMLDMAPTILYLLGLPIPSYMEGHLIREAFDGAYLLDNSEELVENEKDFLINRQKKVLSEKEEEEIWKQLKGLGYL